MRCGFFRNVGTKRTSAPPNRVVVLVLWYHVAITMATTNTYTIPLLMTSTFSHWPSLKQILIEGINRCLCKHVGGTIARREYIPLWPGSLFRLENFHFSPESHFGQSPNALSKLHSWTNDSENLEKNNFEISTIYSLCTHTFIDSVKWHHAIAFLMVS